MLNDLIAFPRFVSSTLALVLLASCGRSPGDAQGDGQGAGTIDPSLNGPSLAELDPTPYPAPAVVRHGDFATGAVCAQCHQSEPSSTALKDAAGRNVGPVELWQATMMANASRDPLFRAVVSAEQARVPVAAKAIAAECLHCHAPMASVAGERSQTPVDDTALLTQSSPLGDLARDGISCTLCHQMEPTQLGDPGTFSGNYRIGASATIYGPYANPFTTPMVSRAGYTPTQGAHVNQSEMCASCHVLDTGSLDTSGTPTGNTVHEQATYLEWKASQFGRSGEPADRCQGCHMPTADEDGNPIFTRIAHRPSGGDFPAISPRSPYWRHLFVGGNTLIPGILRDNATLYGVVAPPAAFDAVQTRARAMLSRQSADVSVERVVRTEDSLSFSVRVKNLAGHRFPSGYPSRRAWLVVRVVDNSGAVLFSSGRFDGAGRILGGDGTPLPSELAGGPLAPHLTAITSSDEVQIYESALGNADGRPSASLLGSTETVKDNRLLPVGWQPDAAWAASVRAIGTESDADFAAGQDLVGVKVPVAPGAVPARIEIELRYQTLSARFRNELFESATPEVQAFKAMLRASDLTPELVASAQVAVP